MTATRSSEKYPKAAELKENVLPANEGVLQHYFFKRNVIQHSNAKFFKKFPEFTDLKYEVAADVAKLWIKASLPILSKSRIETKFFNTVNKLRAAKKRAIKSQSQSLTETWLFELFDISACKCKNSANPNMQFWNGKFACSCPFEHRIPAEEIDFLRDQRESGNMILTSKVDIAHRKQQEKKMAKKRKNEQPELLKRRGRPRKVLITSEQLPTTGHNEEVELELVGDDEFCCVINKPKIRVAEIVTKTKCVLADRRCTSVRQQANQLTPENFENPGTSKSSIHRKREKYRIESLKSAQLKHVTVDPWQLRHDGKIIDGIDRYVLIGQCFDQEKVSIPLQVKS